jgi:hypothetical protein
LEGFAEVDGCVEIFGRERFDLFGVVGRDRDLGRPDFQ